MQTSVKVTDRVAADNFVWLVGSLAKLHRIAFDAGLLLQRFPPPYGRPELQLALKLLGCTIQEQTLASVADVRRLSIPYIAFRRIRPGVALAGENANESLDQLPRGGSELSDAVLVVKTDGDRALYFSVGSDEPRTVQLDALLGEFESTVLTAAYAHLDANANSSSEQRESPRSPACETRAPFGLRWFAPELLRHRKIWRDVLFASLIIQLLGMGIPMLTQITIDKVVVHQTRSTLVVVAAGMAIFVLFGACMTWIRQYLVIHTGNRVDAVLGTQVFAHLVRLPHPYFQHRPTGSLVARLQGIETIREFITGAAIALLLDLPFMLVFLAVMFIYSWELTLIAMVMLLLIGGISLAVAPRFRARLNEQFLLGARNQAFMTEYVAGMETVKSLQLEPQLERRYGDHLAGYLSSTFKTKRLGNSYNVTANTLEQLQTLAILVVGALLVMRNEGFTIGMLVAFQMFAGRLAQPTLRLVGLYQQFQEASVAIRRLGDLMDFPAEPSTIAPMRAGKRHGRIELRGLSFRYSEAHPHLFRNVTVSLDAGKIIAITGPSGCGKSTLVKLLQGLYLPSDGQILIDGIDLRHLPTNELRSYFGVVPQETVLFSGTVYENVAMANPQTGFDDVVMACKLAGIHEVIERMPQGYQSHLGERGVGLSGGQRQRLAIARALIKRPRVLIFDEATSGLDESTAEAIAQTVNAVRGQASVIFIAHQVPKSLRIDFTVSMGVSAPATPSEKSAA